MAEAHRPMGDAAGLGLECTTWMRYLIGAAPSAALAARYVEAHRQGVVEPAGGADPFDRALVHFARRGTFAARLCDAHARLFRPAGLLRRKLVLTLALAEVDAQAHGIVDRPRGSSPAGALARIARDTLIFALLAAAGLALFLPLRLVCAFGGKGGRP